jgi:hypothetical protein
MLRPPHPVVAAALLRPWARSMCKWRYNLAMRKSAMLFTASFVLLLLVSACRADIVYTAEMEKFGKKSNFKVWTSDSSAKFSVLTSDDTSMPPGMTILALDGGARYVILNASKNSYVDLTLEQFNSLRGKQALNHGVEFKSGKRDELKVDEDGGKVAGVQTRYYKFKISVTVTEQGQKEDIVANEEFWTAPSIKNPSHSLDMLTNQTSGISELDSLLEYKKLRGYPLKRVVEISINGQPAGSSLVEVQAIRVESLADSTFEIPATYKKIEIPGQAVELK